MRGSIPSSLGRLTNLYWLDLDGNSLSGSIPSRLGDLTNLIWLDLGGNSLSGSIPSSLGGLANLHTLYLSFNSLSGSIPSSLGRLANLNSLALGANALRGSIPSSLGRLTNLEYLDLSSNALRGSIPSSLGGLTDLGILWLRYNHLRGSIPAALCRFESTINPQHGGTLPCAESSGAGMLEARLVPGDRQLTVSWTVPSDDVATVVDGYVARYRAVAQSETWTELSGTERGATSATIAGLTNGTAYEVQVRPAGGAGAGAWSASVTGTPGVPDAGLSFGDARIEDQRFRQYAVVAPVALPAARGGAGAVTYALSPAVPAGLVFDAGARTLGGMPSTASSATTYTYSATDAGGAAAMLTFTIEVEMSAEEAALRRDALAAQGRALLSSVTGVIGERLRPRSGPSDREATQRSARALGEALLSMLGVRAGGGRALAPGGSAHATGAGPGGRAAVTGRGAWGLGSRGRAGGHAALASAGAGRLSTPGSPRGVSGLAGIASFDGRSGHGVSAPGSAGKLGGFSTFESGGFGGGLPALGGGSSAFGAGGWDGLWGQSFSAPLPVGAGGGESSRYTVWGAGDVQSFSGSPEAGRYSGDVRSLYVGADGRLGSDWLAGAAVSRSWGSADYTAAVEGARPGRLTTGADERLPLRAGRGDAHPGRCGPSAATDGARRPTGEKARRLAPRATCRCRATCGWRWARRAFGRTWRRRAGWRWRWWGAWARCRCRRRAAG